MLSIVYKQEQIHLVIARNIEHMHRMMELDNTNISSFMTSFYMSIIMIHTLQVCPFEGILLFVSSST